jgi:hypothetical protein
MRYYIYLLALCLLLMLASSAAHASESSLDFPVAASFQISGIAKATDSASAVFGPGPGKIEITGGDHALYIRVPGAAGNGTRLVSLDDYESDIVFRNNTLLLPFYAGGTKTGTLVVATDNLTADSYGYAGLITGLELDSGKIVSGREGHNFTADVILSLTDLPAGATYRVAFADNASLSAAVSADLEASGLTAAAASPPVEVSASTMAGGNVVSFVILTIETEGNWTGSYGDNNLTFYRFAVGQLSRLRFSAIRSDDGSVAYQAISPGAGQFMIVAGAPREAETETVAANNDGLLVLGGLLATLVIALAIMVRRVAKR